jgi:hypothetical protein
VKETLDKALRRLTELLKEPHTALLVTSCKERTRMAAAWPLIGAKLKTSPPSKSEPPAELPELIDWVWSHYDYDLERWARVAQVTPDIARMEARALIEGGMILPDGCLSPFCDKLLKGKIWKLYPKK